MASKGDTAFNPFEEDAKASAGEETKLADPALAGSALEGISSVPDRGGSDAAAPAEPNAGASGLAPEFMKTPPPVDAPHQNTFASEERKKSQAPQETKSFRAGVANPLGKWGKTCEEPEASCGTEDVEKLAASGGGPGWKLIESSLDLKVQPYINNKGRKTKTKAIPKNKSNAPGDIEAGQQSNDQPINMDTQPQLTASGWVKASRQDQYRAFAAMLEGKLQRRKILFLTLPLLLIPALVLCAVRMSYPDETRFIPLIITYVCLTLFMLVLPSVLYLVASNKPLVYKWYRAYPYIGFAHYLLAFSYPLALSAALHALYDDPAHWLLSVVLIIWLLLLFYGAPVRVMKCPGLLCCGIASFRRARVKYNADQDRLWRLVRDRRIGNGGESEGTLTDAKTGETRYVSRTNRLWKENSVEEYYIDHHGKAWLLPSKTVHTSISAMSAASRKGKTKTPNDASTSKIVAEGG